MKSRAPRKSVSAAAGNAKTASARGPRGCPIVGVGASAGGLEAFTQFLRPMPSDTGIGFVFVQHLDPKHESSLSQILSKVTAMPVHEAKDKLRVEANHVYVIPPNAQLVVAKGVLRLRPRERRGGGANTINLFFEALANDQCERAIGVILSGNATDGTLGIEAIKGKHGLTFAQDHSARFNSMPSSAVASGCVDYVLTPEKIAAEIARIARHPLADGLRGPPKGVPEPGGAGRSAAPGGKSPGARQPGKKDAGGLERVLAMLREFSGVDFSHYKLATLQRRIARRAVLTGKATIEEYAGFLSGNNKEFNALFAAVMIGVTSFFRNPGAYEALKRKVFPGLLKQGGPDPVRVWVLGCSTGQEAYSIAMAFMETADAYPRPRGLQVFATDVNEESLTKARRGFYTKNMVHDVSPARLKRFFVEVDGGYQVIKPLREILVFARQNALRDPPFSRMDLISCRNLMIYLVTDPQRRLLPNFHYALKPGGSLLLGSSESVGQFTDLFAPVDRKNKIFSKRVAQNPTFNLAGPNGGDRRPRADRAPNSQARRAYNASEGLYGGQNPEREADRLMLLRFSPPGVVVNESLQILQFRGPTGEFLEPQSGKASFDLLRMVREGLMLPLRAALNFAKKNHQAVRTKAVRIKGGGADRDVMMEVIPIKNLKEPCFMVLFISHDPGGNGNHGGHPPAAARDTPPIESAPGGDGGSHLVVSLERELSETRDYLHSVQEDQEMANEELQASNEEGQSVNEELQSLNEELETSKEELESTNEELMTVNEDMVHRNSELQQLNNDLRNIETSTHLAIVLLTCDLKIRHFSTEAEMILRLNAEDIGAPIGSSCQGLPLPDVATVAMECISRRLPAERELQDKAGSWYLLRVRPSLAADGTVDGAVLVLIDINHLKATEKLITEARQHAEAIIRTVPSPMLILGPDLRIRSANDAFSRAFKTSPKEFVGKPFFEIGRGEWNFAGLQRLLDDVIHNDGFFDSFEVARSFKRVGHRSLELFGRVLVESSERPRSVLLGIRDVTSARLAELELARARALLVDHAESLEQTVVERTKELTKANEHLLLSIDAIKKGKDSYRVLLARSEDMQHQLRQITRRIIAVQEEERKQISRELHDDVVQSLIGISFEISCILKDAPGDPERVRERIEGTQKTVQRSVEAVHRFARGLRPALLDDIGLVAALHSYCNSLAAREKIEIEVDASGEFAGLNGEKRTVLFRVAQEALTNVVRHAQASKALVSIHPGTDTVLMVVSDNGRSFNVEDATGAKSTRLGLVGMKERVDMVGGTLLIESTPGKGTSVQIEIPLSSSPPIPTPKQ